MKNWFVASLCLALVGGLAATGCATTDNISDCHSICDRYHDCYDSSYDVSSCYDHCRSQSEADSSFEHDVNVCDACISGIDCTKAAFDCGTQCSSIVP